MAIGTNPQDIPRWSTSKNDVTGNSLVSKPPSESYSDGWDLIWGNKGTDDKIDEELGQ